MTNPTGTEQTENNSEANVTNQTDETQSIVNRVANFKAETTQSNSNQSDEVVFDPKMFDNIKSAEDAKRVAESAYKSYEKGFQKKFQDVAELRKTLESKVTNEPSSWTTERVNTLLKDPSFVAAAQGMLGETDNSMSDESYSALSESEKRRIDTIEKQNKSLIQKQNQFLQHQQDDLLKQKYPNYKSDAVDTITAELLQGKVKNTREYIWKAFDYEPGLTRAYELGKQDARTSITENAEVASFTGGETQASSDVKREKGESNENLMRRLYTKAVKGIRSD